MAEPRRKRRHGKLPEGKQNIRIGMSPVAAGAVVSGVPIRRLSGAAVAPHAVTFRDRVGRLRQFLIASGQIQMTASTRTRRKIEQP